MGTHQRIISIKSRISLEGRVTFKIKAVGNGGAGENGWGDVICNGNFRGISYGIEELLVQKWKNRFRDGWCWTRAFAMG